jgi:tetratricopeptide (TPR) repeat protein
MKLEQQAIVVILYAVVIGIPLAGVAAAITLRLACLVCRVAVPGFWKALKTVAIAGVVGSVVFAVGHLMFIGGNFKNPPPIGVLAELTISLFTFVVTVAVYSNSLQITPGRATLVRLTETAIIGVIGLLAGGAIVLGLKINDAWQNGTLTFGRPAAPQAAAIPDKKSLAVSRTQSANRAFETDDLERALPLFPIALGSWEELTAESPREAEYRREIARIHFKTGEIYRRTNRLADAETAYRKALPIWEGLAVEDPKDPECRECLARLENALGLINANANRKTDAETAYLKAVAIWEGLATAYPAEPRYRKGLARTRINLGAVLAELGRLPASEECQRSALETTKRLAAEFPGNREYLEELAWSQTNLGRLLMMANRRQDAEGPLRDGLDSARRLESQAQKRFEYDWLIGIAGHNWGDFLWEARRLKECASAYGRAGISYSLLGVRSNNDIPGMTDRRERLGVSLCKVAAEFGRRNEFADVERYYGEAIRTWRELCNDFPSKPEYRRQLAWTHGEEGQVLSRSPESNWQHWARIRLNDAINLYTELAKDFPKEASHQRELVALYRRKAEFESRYDPQSSEVAKYYEAALTIARRLATEFPNVKDYQREVEEIRECLKKVRH